MQIKKTYTTHLTSLYLSHVWLTYHLSICQYTRKQKHLTPGQHLAEWERHLALSISFKWQFYSVIHVHVCTMIPLIPWIPFKLDTHWIRPHPGWLSFRHPVNCYNVIRYPVNWHHEVTDLQPISVLRENNFSHAWLLFDMCLTRILPLTY